MSGHSYGISNVTNLQNFNEEMFWKEVTSQVEEKISEHYGEYLKDELWRWGKDGFVVVLNIQFLLPEKYLIEYLVL